MIDSQFTVKAIAELITLTDEADELARVIEQLRYWTREGLLHPATRKHSGTGRWRRYSVEQVYRAALLCEFSRVGLSIGAMKTALMWLRMKDDRDTVLWDAATKGNEQVFYVVWFHFSSEDCFGRLVKGPVRLDRAVEGDPSSTLSFNLSRIFSRIPV